ncbi:RHS repeat-associated protein [Sphingomonas naasensis]|uniref:RHS repeat-associated core domain-containing protein n=1 Tax=Sphingomonas naasensis TaxID=1344951 RepID=A0A4S1WLL9_9SPHN|nr:RHS repeat-associated core domain-containing protein [Sphingomonas naasensis]NIJ20938.1 RHS repeat-associated protein [Sphingomonas naasensis]TGX43325.1 hypothetical protein E5A74_09175 [Sphingomonas naasensis]
MLDNVGASRPGNGNAAAKFLIRSLLASASLLTLTIPTAQAQQIIAPPVRPSIDGNGVDLFTGTLQISSPSISAGQQSNGLAYARFWRGFGWSDDFSLALDKSGSTVTVNLNRVADSFTDSGGSYTPTEGNGATLTFNSGTNIYTYTRSDGTVARFSKNLKSNAYSGSSEGRALDITSPSGEKVTFGHETANYCLTWKQTSGDPVCLTSTPVFRLTSATNAYGYQLNITYQDEFLEGYPNNLEGWMTVTGATISNLARPSSPVVATLYHSVSASGGYSYQTYQDTAGRQTVYRTNGAQMLGIKRPGSSSEDVTFTYSGSRVASVTTAAGTTNYSASDAGGARTVTVTDTGSHATTYVFDIAKARMTSMTDPLSRTTSWQYDANGRLTRTTLPEGNYTQITYDGRGNVTERRDVAKAGSGLADIVTSATFAASCSNPATCNKPITTTDARGNVTNYSYDATHGGVTAVTAPAATSGAVRPEVRYGYSTLQAYFNTSGSMAASGQPVTLLTSTSTCQTTASCAGTSDEIVASITYGPQVAGTGNNLLPVSVIKGSGSFSLLATTSYTYDDSGDLLTVDGPMAGSADTTRYRYDNLRRRIGVTSPDPDGAGPLKPRAQKITYDPKGRATQLEIGNVNSQSDADWVGFVSAQQVTTSYDGVDRKVQETLAAGGGTYGVTQYSYDSDGRLDCTAVRMNSATWSALPSACTLSTTGAAGPDRITRNFYDSADQLTKVQTAYGTADQSDEVANSYTSNGKIASVTDGEGNRTSYDYDGFDRLLKTRYPVTAVGAGTSSAGTPPGDYEELGYDPASNVTSRRLRDGQTITYGYDNLSRLTSKVTPGSAYQDWDVTYGYDLLGQVKTATGNGWAVNAFSYDALGRITIEQNYGGTTSNVWDLAGRRTRLIWSDSFYVDYDYNLTGDVTAIRENGATSGVGLLATYGYDDLGRRTSITRGNGTTTSYGYDAASRLGSLSQDLVGSAQDFTHSFSYNPAGQIASLTRNNDSYAWTGHYNVDRPYGVNGRNQLTTAGATSLGYDGRGNLTSSGASIYAYTSENRMYSAPGGVAMAYEPAGGQLLQLYTGAGVDTRFVWSGSQMVGEIVVPSGAMTRRYVPGPGTDEPVVWYEGSGTSDRRWLHADERGSIVAVSDGSGNAIGINRYDEYGIPAATNIGRFQYTGQAWLPDLGMYYYKARIYSPSLGRFMQTDPIGYGDGMNLYNYVAGDPVNHADPTGTELDKSAWRCYGNCGGGYANSSLWPAEGTAKVAVEGGSWASASSTTNVISNGGGCGPVEKGEFGICRTKESSSGVFFDFSHFRDAFGNIYEGEVAVIAAKPQNRQSMTAKMSEDEQEAENEKDEAICRSLPTVGQRGRCWASAGDRRGARADGRPLPPLVTWRTSVPGPTLPRPSAPNPWVTGGLILGGAGVVCVIVEPCGAAALGVLGLGSLGLLGAQ